MKKFLLSLVIFITFIGTIYSLDWGTFSYTDWPTYDALMIDVPAEHLVYIVSVYKVKKHAPERDA
jgi:hypothetical protein